MSGGPVANAYANVLGRAVPLHRPLALSLALSVVLAGCAHQPGEGPDRAVLAALPSIGSADLAAFFPGEPYWVWRMRGDRSVRPAWVADNGTSTMIAFAPGQALPAVFAIGPTGAEEVVNGHMRGTTYVIDRVYDQLVFRIDADRASARRPVTPETAG